MLALYTRQTFCKNGPRQRAGTELYNLKYNHYGRFGVRLIPFRDQKANTSSLERLICFICGSKLSVSSRFSWLDSGTSEQRAFCIYCRAK